MTAFRTQHRVHPMVGLVSGIFLGCAGATGSRGRDGGGGDGPGDAPADSGTDGRSDGAGDMGDGGGSAGSLEEDFVGPFPSWANVKATYGVKGDGASDDTTALQKALDEVGQGGKPVVLYLPGGNYRITSTLSLKYRAGVSVIGEDPATTKIKWAGPSGGTMFWVDGVAYSRFDRITFDGSSTAGIAVDQSMDNLGGNFDTGNEYTDDVFQDVQYGIQGGALGFGFAETSVWRSTFRRNSQAGIILKNFNALDLWVWDSTFDSCGVGITNNPGAGNWKVYNSLFKNSTVADLAFGNTGGFSARNNTSIGSNMFLDGSGSGNPALVSLQGNTIIDPIKSAAISFYNQGPILFVDNTVRSRPGAAGPVFSHASPGHTATNGEDIVIGNTFTVASPIFSECRLISFDNATVDRGTLAALQAPTLPPTPKNRGRQVFEVRVGADAAAIQAAINQAHAAGNRPVVHVPAGTYAIGSTLSIPANSDVQLVGDGDFPEDTGTWLRWTGAGAGPVLKIAGPTKATMRSFAIGGGKAAEGIRVEGIDQPGARVFTDQGQLWDPTQANFVVDGLDHTRVDLRNFSNGSYTYVGVGLKVIGGSLANGGAPAGGGTAIFSGGGSGTLPIFSVANGGQLLVRDYWAEQGRSPFADLSDKGTFTLDNGLVALPFNQPTPAFRIDGFKGKVSVLETLLWDRMVISGDGSQAKVMALGLLGGLSSSNEVPASFVDHSSPGADARLLDSRQQYAPLVDVASKQVVDVGSADPDWMKDMLGQTRGQKATALDTLPPGITDLRLFRVSARYSTVNVHLVR